MKQHRFLHVTLILRKRANIEGIRAVIDRAPDWMHYSDECWLLRTKLSPETWYNRLKDVIGDDGRALIYEVDLSGRFGRVPQWVWEWIDQYLTD